MTTTFDQSMQLKKIGIVQNSRLLYVTGPEIPVPVIYDESISGQGFSIHCCAFTENQLIEMIGSEPRLVVVVDIPSGLSKQEFRCLMPLRIRQARINALFDIVVDIIRSGDNSVEEINSRIKPVSIS